MVDLGFMTTGQSAPHLPPSLCSTSRFTPPLISVLISPSFSLLAHPSPCFPLVSDCSLLLSSVRMKDDSSSSPQCVAVWPQSSLTTLTMLELHNETTTFTAGCLFLSFSFTLESRVAFEHKKSNPTRTPACSHHFRNPPNPTS